MSGDVFTEDERRYLYSFKPNGFIRAWHSAYASRCHAGPWTLHMSSRRMLFAAIERGNRVGIGRIPFDGFWGWSINIPYGFGTVALWGYTRPADAARRAAEAGRE